MLFGTKLESLIEQTHHVLGEEGILSQTMEKFEFRREQMFMSESICHSLAYGEHLICEAGTGTGKSLAYLVPLIFWTVDNDKRVVITTNTKTLQEQILKKDIPFLKKECGLEFTAELAVGSANYICLRRLSEELTSAATLFSLGEFDELKKIRDWIDDTETGLFDELEFIVSPNVKSHIGRDKDLCLRQKCKFYKECFLFKARARWEEANIIVANHHMFFANLATGGNILPKYDAIVFDEAHNVEEIAVSYFGHDFSNTSLRWLFNSIFNFKTKKGILLRAAPPDAHLKKIKQQLEECQNACDDFFKKVMDMFKGDSFKERIQEKNFIADDLSDPLSRLSSMLKAASELVTKEESKFELKAFSDKCKKASEVVTKFMEQDMEDWVYWIEGNKRSRFQRVEFNINPVIVADMLKEKVFDVTKPCIMTSATLAIDRKYDYLKQFIGLEDAVEVILDSPFDYKNNVLFYTNPKAPNPNSPDYVDYCGDAVEEIITQTQGKAFILSTNYKLINSLSERFGDEFNGHTILKQGDAPRHYLLEEFREDEHSVLLATSTFWEGVDVQGSALECVVITRLPFEVPDEPTVKAKTEYLEKIGKDPFFDYQLPRAVLMLKQGFGRLIRSKKDIGIVAILDPRIRTRRYGAIFINSLPACRAIPSISQIQPLLKDIRKKY